MGLVIYKSSAGSGKTFTLVKEYLKIVLQNPNDYKHILAMTFTNKATEEMKSRIKEDDTFNFLDLNEFAPDKQITLELVHTDGSKEEIKLNHTYNEQQIEWFKAGSALNLIRRKANA